MAKLIVAYEPVWAIGTGRNATPDQAQEAHAHIRSYIAAAYGPDTASRCRIIYGGSVKPGNVAALSTQPDVELFHIRGCKIRQWKRVGGDVRALQLPESLL